jgi:glutamine cyclotransferase
MAGCSIVISSCGSGNQKASSLFDIALEDNKTSFTHNEVVGISIKNKKQKTIENVSYMMDGKSLQVNNGKITLTPEKLGNKTVTANITYEGNTVQINKNIKILSSKSPDIYTYTIIKEYPHDPTSYTQGLEFHQDTLYEGTGKNGRSILRKYDYENGNVFQEIKLDNTYFGEGITILDNKIYQLTWRSGIGFVYNLKDMKKLDNFKYGKSKEGWGLTNDGKKLYKSDGTEKIWILDPETLIEEDHIETVTNKSIFNQANELEYVDGKIYANVYQKPSVMIIDAASGAIEGVVNFSGLSDKVTKTQNWVATDNVLNGIAYHPERKTFFVTGKEWDKLFEVTIQKK